MTTPAECCEREAIREALRNAADAIRSSPGFDAARKALLTVFQSTDEESVDAAFRTYGFRLNPAEPPPIPSAPQAKLNEAYHRLWKHRALTGHWPLPRR